MGRHKCANCGQRFEGRYCPACGQHFADGPITWKSVRRDVMKIWGMDSSSLPHTVWQLIRRPGQHIDSYLCGHRQESYPPTKMIFLVALVYAIAKQIFDMGTPKTSLQVDADTQVTSRIIDWLSANPGWSMLSMTTLLILPTWILFRFAPRHTKHSLPESIFIQLFMSTLLVVCSFFSELSSWISLLIPFYYYICYRHLFGYRFWGTLWRLMLCGIIWVISFFCLFIFFMCLEDLIPNTAKEELSETPLIDIIVLVIAFLFLIATPLAIGYWVGKHTYNKRQQADIQK